MTALSLVVLFNRTCRIISYVCTKYVYSTAVCAESSVRAALGTLVLALAIVGTICSSVVCMLSS